MCRFLAYSGEPLLLEALVAAPCRSLIHQSLHASECQTGTNGDGFGLGWYGERAEPGLYREVRPAWSDENLRSLCAQVRSPLFFAHVRAATGTATTRANCHPYAHGRHLFMHNGQVGGWSSLRRRVEALIPDELYPARGGTTDSEAIFLAALGRGLAEDPLGALAATCAAVRAIAGANGVAEPFRLTATLSDGTTLWAVRWASDGRPPSLYYRAAGSGLVLASEPIDDDRGAWREVPVGCALIAAPGRPPVLRPLEEDIAAAA